MKQLLAIFLIWSITCNKPLKTKLRSTLQEGWNEADGGWVYIKNGARLTGWQELSWRGGTSWFYFNGKGLALKGWQELNWTGGVNWFYFDPTDYYMTTGWKQLSWTGGFDWFYFDEPKGYMYASKLAAIGGKSYYFDGNGCWGGKSIVERAKKYIGTPYVWGGTTPSGFDCSGFVQYVYREAGGVELTRTTYTQINEGTGIGRDSLQPGDLVFPSADHVGMYVGDGKMIHASSSAKQVIIGDVYNFLAGRRII